MLFYRSRILAALAATGWLFSPSLQAGQPGGIIAVQADGVTVQDAWARASAGAASTGAAYFTLTAGAQADSLVGVSTPVAATAEVHQSLLEDGVMKMRRVAVLTVPAGQTVTLAPGGNHVMLFGLKQPLVAGHSFPVTLVFAHTAPVTVEVKVQALGRGSPVGDHDAMPMH